MISTVEALIITVLALLPGALYTWGFERQVGHWGISLSDRILRFVAVSVAFHALAAPATYILYSRFAHSDQIRHAAPLPIWTWIVILGYVFVPAAVGITIGQAQSSGRRWVKVLLGPGPAPRAWDHLFSRRRLTGWVIIKLKDGTWLAGAYAASGPRALTSYAAGYGEVQDLYLAETIEVTADGKMVRGKDGRPRLRGSGLLVRWDEIMYLEFFESGT